MKPHSESRPSGIDPQHARRGERPRFDRLLRLPPDVQAAWEAEFGQRRIRHIRFHIVFGLLFYNLYNVTSIVLMPDILWQSVILRVFLMMPTGLLLGWAVIRASPPLREHALTASLFCAFAIPIGLFLWSGAPLVSYMLGEMTIIMVFVTVLMNISFPHALIFCGLALITWVGAIAIKTDLSADLQFALTVQAVTSVVFCLLANYHIARQHCVDFLRSYNERQRAETAEVMMQEMTHIAKTDALTGLPNRRFLDEHLERWTRSQPGVAVLLVDIDHFKSFNDTLGHPSGDDCLRRVAAILNSVQDLPDRFVARVGGEEFTIALRHVTVFDAARIGTALVRAVADARMPHPGRPDGKPFVTVSMGLNASASGETTTPRQLVSGADEALYLAKARGRNQLVRAEAMSLGQLSQTA